MNYNTARKRTKPRSSGRGEQNDGGEKEKGRERETERQKKKERNGRKNGDGARGERTNLRKIISYVLHGE